MKNGRQMRLSTIAISALALTMTAMPATIGFAQEPARAGTASGAYMTAITVNGRGISNYEIDQRVRFMQALGQSGNLRAEAETALIEDRLRQWQGDRIGLQLPEDEIKAGMEEFAGRGNMTSEQMVAMLGQGGVGQSTFREFVRSGLIWRYVVRQMYSARVQVTESDIDRAMRVEAQRGRGTRVLMSEVIIPAPPEFIAEAEALARQVAALKGEAQFADAARQVSAASTAADGGRVPMMPIENLPPAMRGMMLAMQPGQISAPVALNGAIGLFQLRGIEAGSAPQQAQILGYAMVTLGPVGTPGNTAMRKDIDENAKSCDDLYTITKDTPALLERVQPVAQSAIPQTIALELAHLDINNTALIQDGGNQKMLMLCSRTLAQDGDAAAPTRDQIRNQLFSERLGILGGNFLAELMTDAVIVRK